MDFQSISDYYKYLEAGNNLENTNSKLSEYLKILINKIDNIELKKICSYELFFIDYLIEDGLLIPQCKIGVNSYPTLALFDDNFEYLKIRAKEIINPNFKAKYNHLLWLSPKKHIYFAKIAVDSYFLILQNAKASTEEKLINILFTRNYKNLLMLSQTINYRKEKVFEYFISLLQDIKFNDITKYSIIDFILVKSKKIDSLILKMFYHYLTDNINNIEQSNKEYSLKVLIALCKKLKLPTNEFYEKLGDFYVLENDIETNSICSIIYLPMAIEAYEKANNQQKIEQTAVLLEQRRKSINLAKVEFEETSPELNKWWAYVEEETTSLVKKADSKNIYGYLILEKIFPGAELLYQDNKPESFNFISVIGLDFNKNINKNPQIFNNYFFNFKNFSLEHIWLIFSKGIRNGKISFESLINHFKNYSWFGEDFTYLDENNEAQGFNWLELLSPSLKNFFSQIEIDIKTEQYNSENHILSIDSLTLKFEGLLREFSKIIGAQTIEINENETKERINIDKLLNNEKLKEVIPEEDIAFFKFLFTNKGINLRNNVAHCFFSTKKYSVEIMLLLVVALLKLGNYKLSS
ncbi:MAG: DUF4209 domain-containing protein [Solirubrobacteraceae bacterium]